MRKRPRLSDIETDIVIIGAGATGITISLELADTGIDFWLLGQPYDSQISKAGKLENTSLPKGTVGLEYIEELVEELEKKSVNHKTSLSTGIEVINDSFLVKTKHQSFRTKRVVIATGRKQKKLGFEGEKEYFRKGISDCAVCDGRLPIFRNGPLAVVGNHKYTKNATEYLTSIPNSGPVYLLWLDDLSTCPDIEGVEKYYGNVTINKVTGDKLLQKIQFSYNDNKEETLELAGLFVEGKPIPSSSFVKDLDNLEMENGYIKVDENLETSIPNIFAAGEITGEVDSYDGAVDHGKKISKQLVSYFK